MASGHPLPEATLGSPGLSALHAHTIASQVRSAKVKAMHDVMLMAQVSSLISSFALVAALWGRVPSLHLTVWIAVRCVVSAWRIRYSMACEKLPGLHRDSGYMLLAFLDGLTWSAMGWGLTPLFDLTVSIFTIPLAVAVSCIAVMMLHVHEKAAWLFQLPILVPNGLYALQRHDELGTFCCIGLLGLSGILLVEGARMHARAGEMIRLRFESEQAHQLEKQAMQAVQRQAEMRSRFVATVSHEMRTPLHGLMGLLRLVQAQADRPPDARHLALMQGAGQHLLSVINDVLDFAKLESSGLPISPQPMRLDALLADVADTVRLQCEGKGLRLVVSCHLTVPCWVQGDDTRIRQILINLLGNAIKFTQQGQIHLKASRSDSDQLVRLVVQDSGVGIPPHELGRIFEPYQQAEGTYERRLGGTGLGLTISQELCKAMGGVLRCESEVGVGSTFTCELPLQATTPPAPQPAPDAPWAVDPGVAPASLARGASTAPRVLLVDDNPVNLIVGEAELLALGMQVASASHGAQALAWLEDHRPDLILMDCELPDMDGLAVTREIRARQQAAGQPPTPIVALTANSHETFPGECLDAGMNGLLGKPFDRAELAATLRKHLPLGPSPSQRAMVTPWA
jgi:signal transduction histidine kinase/ActR/RegA family two-component response regulator